MVKAKRYVLQKLSMTYLSVNLSPLLAYFQVKIGFYKLFVSSQIEIWAVFSRA
jgi:hypothetical protein